MMTEKEIKKLMGIYPAGGRGPYWNFKHPIETPLLNCEEPNGAQLFYYCRRDPANAVVDAWRAGEESRRAHGEKEARRVRKKVRAG